MNRRNLVFLLVGLFFIVVGSIISFQNNQASGFIGTLFSDIGFLINFLQIFFAFPLFPLWQNPRDTPSPFSRVTRYILIARGVCFILLGIIGIISFFAFTSVSNAYAIQVLVSVGGGIVFLSGMATILMALQERNIPRRRLWFLLEGIFGSLTGWSFMSASATGTIYSPGPLGDVLFAFSFLFFVLWIVTTGIGEIIASNGWALTAGGALSFGEMGAIAGSLTGNGAIVFFALFCYPMLFGGASILGAFKDRGGSSVGRLNIPPLSQLSRRSQLFLTLAAVWLIIVSGTFSYSMTHIVEEQVVSIALAQQVGDPYGGSLLISDPMSEPGSAFGWENGIDSSGNECNFKDGGYHVSGFCSSKAAIPPKFAFEIVLTTSQSCSDIDLYFNSAKDDFSIGICQNGAYTLYSYSDSGSASGSASSMNTATDQSNLIGIVADGTDMTLYINQVKVASVSDTSTGTGSLYIHGLDANAALLNGSSAIGNTDNREVVYTNALLWSL